MKKLLIVSLFLLGMAGLFAQAHLAVFNLETEAGGYHAADAVGFKACTVMPAAFGGAEQWEATSSMFWNWNTAETGLNSAATFYIPGTDPDTPGQILIQMASFTTWGVSFGPGNVITANFYFIDGEGNETGPYSLAKSAVDATYYPDVISWGGPAPVTTPGWATLLGPVDAEATSAPLDVILNWEPSAEEPVATGFDFYFNGTFVEEVTMTTDYLGSELALEYATDYTWGVRPYVGSAEPGKKGTKASREKVYAGPVEDMPVWTFTTMDEPVVIEGPDSWATAVNPADEAVDVALDAQLSWSYSGEVTPTGYMLEWNGGEAMDLGNVMTYNPGALDYNTEYTWSVIPYVNNAAKRGMKATRELLEPAGEKPVWSFTTMAEYVAPAEEIGGTDIDLTIIFAGPTPAGFTPAVPTQIFEPSVEYPLPALTAFNFGVTVNQGTAGQFTYEFSTALLAGRVFVNGVEYLHPGGNFIGGVVVVVVNFTGAKDGAEIVITEPTLPVELSSFTAVAHADEYVTLNWVAESESNLHGYNVYRAETESFEQAMRINPTTVAANNSTQTSVYTYTDTEVETATYYYWLEVSELSNENTFHGPIVVTVEDDAVVPGITETTFRNFGPSPFTSSTSTTLRVKEGETASVTIYNLLGQVVRRESFNAGEHNFTFNGKDTNNRSVANGIYFVKMTSPTTSKSFKIVKIK